MNETLVIFLQSLAGAVVMIAIITSAMVGMFKIGDGGTKNKIIGFFLVTLAMTSLIFMCGLSEKYKQDSKKTVETVVENK